MGKPTSAKQWLLICLTICVLFIPALRLDANTIIVDERCTLIQAIGSANNNSSKDRCERGYRDDTIFLKKDIVLDEILPEITSTIIIEGNGNTIYVKAKHPAFEIKWGNLTIKNLTVKFRDSRRSSPTIYVKNGSLTIIDSAFERCTGKFQVLDSLGVVHGDSDVCGYSAETVASWFGGAPPPATPTPLPTYPHTCTTLTGTTATLSATYGLQSGVQCQQLDAAGIGNASVIAAGYIDAVDVWGYVEQGVEICFQQPGSIVFLDASTAPRSVVALEYTYSEKGTCVALDRPGTVVLAPGPAVPVEIPSEPLAETVETTAASVDSEPTTEDGTGQVPSSQAGQCSITLTGHLSLRSEPAMDGIVIGHVLRGTTLSSISRTPWWFNVEYQGKVGWIGASARYVQTSGACD